MLMPILKALGKSTGKALVKSPAAKRASSWMEHPTELLRPTSERVSRSLKKTASGIKQKGSFIDIDLPDGYNEKISIQKESVAETPKKKASYGQSSSFSPQQETSHLGADTPQTSYLGPTTKKKARTSPQRVNRAEADAWTARLNADWDKPYTGPRGEENKKRGGTVGFKSSHFMKELHKCR